MDEARFPMATGAVVKFLGVRERRLQDAVRQGVAQPTVVAGRRLWTSADVLAVARHLGVDSLPVRRACQEAERQAQPPAADGEVRP
jgi:hypothetical protein